MTASPDDICGFVVISMGLDSLTPQGFSTVNPSFGPEAVQAHR